MDSGPRSRSRLNTSAVVLAAGRSSRMGCPKLLLPVKGKPMIAVVVDELLASPIDRVYVVISEAGNEVRRAIGPRPVEFVVNRDNTSDMLSSVRCGLRAVPDSSGVILVALGDQPGLSRKLVRDMLTAFERSDRDIVVPTWQGQRGHPLLFSARFKQEVLTDFDDTGLRGLLQQHPEQVLEFPASSRAVIEDIDTPADYARLKSDGG